MCAESALINNQNPIVSRVDYLRDMGSHRGANILMVSYAALNLIVANKSTSQDSIVTKLFPLFVILEFLSRDYIVYKLGRHAHVANPVDERVGSSDEDDSAIEDMHEPLHLDDSDYFSCLEDNGTECESVNSPASGSETSVDEEDSSYVSKMIFLESSPEAHFVESKSQLYPSTIIGEAGFFDVLECRLYPSHCPSQQPIPFYEPLYDDPSVMPGLIELKFCG